MTASSVQAPLPGDFSFLGEKRIFERKLLDDAYKSISQLNLWSFFETQSPPEDRGYMFWNPPELALLTKHMATADQHSGASWGWTMRSMEMIAKEGWDAYVAAASTN